MKAVPAEITRTPTATLHRALLMLAVIVVGLLEGATIFAAPFQWVAGDHSRSASLTVPRTGRVGFTQLTNESLGIRFTNVVSLERVGTRQSLLNGAGVAAGDFDGDGWIDLYFANVEGANALYRNLGSGRFTNVTTAANASAAGQLSTGVVWADVDGDGDLDLLISSSGGPNALLRNDGQGHFQNFTAEAGLLQKAGSTSMALADVDGDGDLDLYVANYGLNSILRDGGDVGVRYVRGKPVITGKNANRLKIIDGQLVEFGEPDVLYLNNGKGIFTAVPWTAGAFLNDQSQPLTAPYWDFGLAVRFHDLNGDGWPDLYVCNDFQTPDRIWMNQGNGRFREMPSRSIRSMSRFAMGVDLADLNGDGLDDLLVVDMPSRSHRLRKRQMGDAMATMLPVGDIDTQLQIRQNTLQLSRGDGTYAEVARLAGLAQSDWSWGVAFLDVDLDGYPDVLVANGTIYDTDDMDAAEARKQRGLRSGVAEFPSLRVPNVAFHNRGDLTFEAASAAWKFDSLEPSQGLCLVDLDNDGDLDVVVSCLNSPPLIYRNECDAPRVAVRLRGWSPNTQAIGSRVTLRGGPVPQQSRELSAGGRYLSGDDPLVVFAAGSLTNRMHLEVKWRSGVTTLLSNILANTIYEIDEPPASPAMRNQPGPAPTSKPLFQDETASLGHSHHEDDFDDFALQPLLPWRVSRGGPGVAWVDLDGDGRDVLIVGSGAGGALTALTRDARGMWQSRALPGDDAVADQTGLVTIDLPRGEGVALVNGLRPQTAGQTPTGLHVRDAAKQWAPRAKPVAGVTPAVGPVAWGGARPGMGPRLFVGGSSVPGRYPESAPSQILTWQGEELVVDGVASSALRNVGLVRGVIWTDLTGDGVAELVLACEWGPIRIFQQEAKGLREVTAEWGLTTRTGLWTGVAAGDFDGDGRMDLVVGNWGRNTPYQVSDASPALLAYGDFAGESRIDLIEAERIDGQWFPRANLHALAGAIPSLRARYATHAAFSSATLEAVLGDLAPKSRQLSVNTLDSLLLLNRGGRFEARPLPGEAQWAPVFGLNVCDFDGDGRDDLFLAQNFFAVPRAEPRLDAGRGLLLLGQGNGSFAPMPGPQSGVLIYGEQRGSAAGDFDRDGRVDLAVAQNGAATKLLRNVGGRPGLRVRLRGSSTNPRGVGAQLRLGTGGQWTALREVHAGSGYWSQDSLVTVLGGDSARDRELEIRWPGTEPKRHSIPAGAKEVLVAEEGTVKVIR